MAKQDQTKLAAIVFTDIVGYTQKMDDDEMLTMRYLQRQREIVYPIVKEFGGNILKEIGDGLLIMFDSAVQAVRCSVEIQEQLKDEEFEIRAGIHMGDVIMQDGDVFGSAVNIAARVEPLAKAGGVCVSAGVNNQIRNKADIHTVSIGEKELKGVSETVEIFEVLFGEELEKSKEKISFLKHIWQRRVPHFASIYILFILFTYFVLDYISINYLLSPYIVQFGTIALFSLLPSVMMISYFHGKAASGEWSKIERIGLPVNVIATGLLLFFVFNGKDLGAITTNVNVMDEEGRVIEREITKSEFRKSMAIFFFENESSDTTLNWLGYATPFILNYDLAQDVFLRTESAYDFYQKIKDAGFSHDNSISLILKEKIAKQRNLNYIVSGKTNKINDDFVVKVSLRKTKTSQLISEHTYKGPDIFKLLDTISLQLKYDIDLPERHINEVKDLPVSEILTNSAKAFEPFILALNQRTFYNDFQKAQVYGEQSVAVDPSFMMAYAVLNEVYLLTSQKELSDKTFKLIMKNIISFPERTQFQIKYGYYLLAKQDPDKAFAVVNMWKDLYPDDVDAHLLLATLYQLRNEIENAIAEYKMVLSLDSERYEYLLIIGQLNESQARYDEALESYEEYSQYFPESSSSYSSIGDLYFALGNFESAKSNYEKTLLLEHDNISSLQSLVRIELLSGKYDQIDKQYEEILEFCKTQQDSASIYESLSNYYALIGQMKNSLKSMNSKFSQIAKYTDRVNAIISEALELNRYVKANQTEMAFQIIKGFEKELKAPIDKFISMGYLSIYTELNEIDSIEKSIVGVEDVIQSFQYNILSGLVLKARAQIHVLKGEYENAISVYEELLKNSPTRLQTNKDIGACYRKLKQFKDAEKYLLKALKSRPFNPTYNYEMALLYADMGRKDKAIEHIQISLDAWKNADLDFVLAQKAKDIYNELVN